MGAHELFVGGMYMSIIYIPEKEPSHVKARRVSELNCQSLTHTTMPGRTVQADKHSITIDLSSSLPRIFDQAQISLASHQKNLVALYKHHAEAAQHTESVHNGKGMKLVGERAFEDVLLRILMRVLPMKKGTTQADRIVKFMGGYIKFLNEKGTVLVLLSSHGHEI